MSAYVDDFTYALGATEASVAQSEASGLLFTDAARLAESGFGTHRICPDDQSAYDLAVEACRKVEDHADADAVIYATCLPLNGNVGDPAEFDRTGDVKFVMDFPASRLQSALGLENAFVLGINQQACTGMLGSLRVAAALLASEPQMDSVLCVTSDRFPKGAKYEQAYCLISDGAAACMVRREPRGFRILASHHITNGGLAQASDDETVGSFFPYTHRLILEVLGQAGVQASDLRLLVTQNVNPKAWQILGRSLGIATDRIAAPTLAEVGHVISGDNIINLAASLERESLAAGDKVLLVMNGYGMNWQATLLEKV